MTPAKRGAHKKPPLQPTHFATPAAFRRWLEANHDTAAELWVGYYKKGTGKPSITWQESVDEALCYGWIDGIRKSVDAESYANRFTPRRRGSVWSAVNTRRAEELIREGRMRPAGQRAFEARDPAKSGIYAYEQTEGAKLGDEMEAQFRANAAAWRFFEAQPPGYRKIAVRYVRSAKLEATQARRLATLIAESAAGRRIGMEPPPRPGRR